MNAKTMLALLLALAAPAGAAETACLYEAQGRVSLLKSGGSAWVPVRKGAPVTEGDRLRTGRNAWCELAAKDGTLVKLDPDSEASVDELLASAGKRQFSFSLLKGKALWLAAKVKEAAASRFVVRTNTAVCAVRGTDFAVIVSSSGETSVGLFEGRLEVGEPDGEPRQLEAGGEASVSRGSLAVQPRLSRLMEAERRRWLKVKKRAEDLRKRLAAREDFIDDYIGRQQKKLSDFEKRRREKLDRE